MRLIIDRFEGDFAVAELEDGSFVNLPKCVVPDAKEGDVILITIDRDETKHRDEKITGLMDKLFQD